MLGATDMPVKRKANIVLDDLCNSDPPTARDGSQLAKRSFSVFVADPQALLQELSYSRTHSIDKTTPNGTPRTPVVFGTKVEEIAAFPAAQFETKKEKENIKVAVRIRPKIARDNHELDVIGVSLDGCSITFAPGAEANSKAKLGKAYTYDFVFDSRNDAAVPATQRKIYENMGDRIVKAAIEGYNACLFAYGQTGTGKTHTVIGKSSSSPNSETHEDRGLLPRILEGLYAELDRRRKEGRTVVLKISFLEIYNEMIHDLLVPPTRGQYGGKEQSLTIRYTPGLGLIINDLSENIALTYEDAYDLVEYGMKMRSIAATSMNSRSSRAHTVFTFRMEQEDEVGDAKMAQVQIIDLAGREQEKTSGDDRERLRERSFINKSLFHLSTCISNLSRNNRGKIPEWTFRNSKLTMVLTNSLGKNSKTAMIAAISPTLADLDETISTLRFASQVKLIKNEASCNTVNKRDLVSELQSEIQRLRAEQGAADVLANHELQSQIMQLEALCESYRTNLEQEKERSKELQTRRKECLIEMGLSVGADSSSISVSMEQDVPYLMNFSEDPFLEGCLMYFLKKDEQTSVGSAVDNNIHLVGLGVLPHHCVIANEDNERLTLHLAEALITDSGERMLPRTFVNGRRVLEATAIKHKDRLLLGHAFAFKVYVPLTSLRRNIMQDRNESPMPRSVSFASVTTTTPERLDNEMGLEQALAEVEMEDGGAGGLVRYFCQRYTEHLSSEASNAFTAEVRSAMALVEEANLISQEVRAEENLEFRLQILTDVLSSPMPSEAPSMVIAVMTKLAGKEGSAPNSTRQSTIQVPDDGHLRMARVYSTEQKVLLKFVWSFEKFRDRLQSMRDIYDVFQKQGLEECRRFLRREPYSDPWKEIGNAEVQILLEGLGAGGEEVPDTTDIETSPTGTFEENRSDEDSSFGEESEDDGEYWHNDNPTPTPMSEGDAQNSVLRRSSADSHISYSEVVGLSTVEERTICMEASDMRSKHRRGEETFNMGMPGGTERTWFDIGRRNRKSLFHARSGNNFDFRRATVAHAPPYGGVRPIMKLPVSRNAPSSNERIWKAADEMTPLEPLQHHQVDRNERSLKMKSWSEQIQAKEDVLRQLKENLMQLRALETPQVSIGGISSPSLRGRPATNGSTSPTSWGATVSAHIGEPLRATPTSTHARTGFVVDRSVPDAANSSTSMIRFEGLSDWTR